MSLAQYVFNLAKRPETEVDFPVEDEPFSEERLNQIATYISGLGPGMLFHWNSHYDLHAWMERLYRAKGGVDKNSTARG